MGKFSEMDILLQESYDRGFKHGWCNAVDEAKKVVEDYLKSVKPEKVFEFNIVFIAAGVVATILLLGLI